MVEYTQKNQRKADIYVCCSVYCSDLIFCWKSNFMKMFKFQNQNILMEEIKIAMIFGRVLSMKSN